MSCGTIIYGLAESVIQNIHYADRLEDGLCPEDKVSREWFLQFIRDHIHPPLPDIEAVEVSINDLPPSDPNRRFALVVLVPQSRGVARQTDDFLHWRRDAQGCHRITVQEIEDVRSRTVRPRLDLSALVDRRTPVNDNRQQQLRTQFGITNPSTVTASFAAVTVGLARDSSAIFNRDPEWQWIQTGEDWKIARSVLASGSSVHWSPITPGFTLVAPILTVCTPFYTEFDHIRPRDIRLVRLDHDGGSRLYVLKLRLNNDDPTKHLYLDEYPVDALPNEIGGTPVPLVFVPPS